MKRPHTIGDILALSPAEQEEAWHRLLHEVLNGYHQRDEAYLNGDHAKHGSKQATEWGE